MFINKHKKYSSRDIKNESASKLLERAINKHKKYSSRDIKNESASKLLNFLTEIQSAQFV
jgi:hypothetical protein